MKKTLIGLYDSDAFYCSCEAVFDPTLRNRPIIVASNGDGCCVSRNRAAKSLGIPMGVALFKIRDLIEEHKVAVFSSNYALYGDMSNRVSKILGDMVPEQEVYSIDECFVRIPECVQDATAYAREMRSRVLKYTGIPVSIGMGHSKSLAKIATKVAKQQLHRRGVFDISTAPDAEPILSSYPVEDIWGVGRQYSKWLVEQGIETAKELRDAPEGLIRKKMGVCGVRIQYELRGISCLPVELVPKPKKETRVSRTFGRVITELPELQEAISVYASRAAEKLRYQGQVAEAMQVYACTSPFKPGYYRKSICVSFEIATSDTVKIVASARRAVQKIFETGHEFKKLGVSMTGLRPASQIQRHMWVSDLGWDRRERLMETMDCINQRFGRRAICFAASGVKQGWKSRQKWRTPHFTTGWNDLIVVHS